MGLDLTLYAFQTKEKDDLTGEYSSTKAHMILKLIKKSGYKKEILYGTCSKMEIILSKKETSQLNKLLLKKIKKLENNLIALRLKLSGEALSYLLVNNRKNQLMDSLDKIEFYTKLLLMLWKRRLKVVY